MKKYYVKHEHRTEWDRERDINKEQDWELTYSMIVLLSMEWGKTIEELMEQIEVRDVG